MNWNEALSAAREEHKELLTKRDELEAQRAEIDFELEGVEKRILQLQQTVASLSELTGEASRTLPIYLPPLDLNNLKLADACREILRSSKDYLTPIAVRDALLEQKYDLRPYSNPLASIHAVLKRLRDSNEVVRTAGSDGKAVYRWKFIIDPDVLKAVVDMGAALNRKK